MVYVSANAHKPQYMYVNLAVEPSKWNGGLNLNESEWETWEKWKYQKENSAHSNIDTSELSSLFRHLKRNRFSLSVLVMDFMRLILWCSLFACKLILYTRTLLPDTLRIKVEGLFVLTTD